MFIELKFDTNQNEIQYVCENLSTMGRAGHMAQRLGATALL